MAEGYAGPMVTDRKPRGAAAPPSVDNISSSRGVQTLFERIPLILSRQRATVMSVCLPVCSSVGRMDAYITGGSRISLKGGGAQENNS